MKKIISIVLCMIMVSTLFAACSKPSENTPVESGAAETNAATSNDVKDSIIIAITGDEGKLTPFDYVRGNPGIEVMRLVYDSLFTTDLDNKVIPWMIEDDYEIDESYKIFKVTLLNGLKWHDGKDVTPEDIKFTYEYAETQAAQRWKKIAAQIEKIEINGQEITFTLKAPNTNFLRDGLADMPIVAKHIFEGKEDGKAVTNSVGSGIYKMTEYKPNELYKFEAAEGYFKGDPLVKAINMPVMTDRSAIAQALISGQISSSTLSFSPEVITTFEGNRDFKVATASGLTPDMLYFNCERAEFADAKFRSAIASAINMQTIVDQVFLGKADIGTAGVFKEGTDDYNAGLEYKYDIDAANKILDDLGYTNKDSNGIRQDKDGKALSYKILSYAENSERVRIAELISADLKKIGIDAKVETMEADTVDNYVWPEFDVAEGRDYDMAIWGWGSQVQLNPTSIVSLGYSDLLNGNLNVAGYKSEKYDELCEKYLNTSDMQERSELSKQMQEILAEDNPFITVAFKNIINIYNTKQYDGFKLQMGNGIINKFSFIK